MTEIKPVKPGAKADQVAADESDAEETRETKGADVQHNVSRQTKGQYLNHNESRQTKGVQTNHNVARQTIDHD